MSMYMLQMLLLQCMADFGFGIYDVHHYNLGYFLYAIAVLAKIDPAWGRKYKPQAYSLMADFMNLGRRSNSNYTRLRCLDLYKFHSWAGGLIEFANAHITMYGKCSFGSSGGYDQTSDDIP